MNTRRGRSLISLELVGSCIIIMHDVWSRFYTMGPGTTVCFHVDLPEITNKYGTVMAAPARPVPTALLKKMMKSPN